MTNVGRWVARSDPNKVKAFNAWLKTQVQADIITTTAAKADDAYWKAYVEQGYRKGAGRAFDDTKKPYARGFAKTGDVSDFYKGTKYQFLQSSFGRPVAINKVKLLAGRVYTDLANVTTEMSTQMTRTLTDGLSQGLNPHTIARQMSDRIDKIGKHRATLIARTEVTRAHGEGQLDALEELGVESVGVMVEWSTAGDDRVCPLCEPLDGSVLAIKEARGIIPRHPQCRCAYVPANVGETTKGQQRSKGDLQEARDESIKAEIPKRSKRTLARQKELTQWGGADKRFAKVRPKSVLDKAAPKKPKSLPKPKPVTKKPKVLQKPKPVPKQQLIEEATIDQIRADIRLKNAKRSAQRRSKEVATSPQINQKLSKQLVRENNRLTKPIPTKQVLRGKPQPVSSRSASPKTLDDYRERFLSKYSTILEAPTVKKAQLADSVFSDLSNRFPALKTFAERGKRASLELDVRFKKMGLGGDTRISDGAIRLSNTLHAKNNVPEYGFWRVTGNSFQGTLRHEYGHRYFRHGLAESDRSAWGQVSSKLSGSQKSGVSRYAASSDSELFSESFDAFTHAEYKSGGLPNEIEEFFSRVLNQPNH